MIYPKGNAVYENLNTSFTNFQELLADLKSNNFTGSVQVSFWEYEGNIFIDNGNVVNAVEEIDGNRETGKTAVEQVTQKAQEKGGSIGVFRLKADMVTLLASVVQSEIRYRDLSTDFTSAEGLINKLRSEDHTGFVEVEITDGSQKSYIFFLSGEIIDSLITSGGDEISGSNVLRRIIDAASTQGATFNVYQSAIEESFAEGEEIRLSSQFPHILDVWGDVLEAAERAVGSVLDNKVFLNVFKESLIDHAVEYPFLDPFAAKFRYENGEITYTDEPEKELSPGLGICLQDAIHRLEDEYPQKKIRPRVQQRISEVKQERAEEILRLGIDEDIPA